MPLAALFGHLRGLKRTLGAEADGLTEEIYKERYLALDDRGCITKLFKENGKMLSEANLLELTEAKTKIFQELVSTEGILPFPAVPEFVMALSQRYPLAIASGARRHELEVLLEGAGIRRYFETVVSSDDVQNGKPDPESYVTALSRLNDSGKRSLPIKADECVVIEDSKEGIMSAHAAGMKCVAVATSFPAFELSVADLVVPAIAALKISQIEDLFYSPAPLPIPTQQNN
jgi:HAD superfamily hydrolase (TIGR01509 family)